MFLLYPALLALLLLNTAVVTDAYGQADDSSLVNSFGLVPSVYSLMRAEAITASGGLGGDSLFYNPASLSSGKTSIGLAGLGTNMATNDEILQALEAEGSQNTIEKALRTIDLDRPAYASVSSRLLDINIPYFAMVGFTQVSAESRNPASRVDENYKLDAKADLGASIGLALSYNKLSLGISHYIIRRASVSMLLTQAQMQSFRDAYLSNSVNETTLPFNEISSVNSGGAIGYNYGLQYRFFENNLTALGIAVLNAGSTSFKSQIPYRYAPYEKQEKKISDSAENYGITLAQPEKLPEIMNIGFATGFGGGADDIFKAEFSVDYNDVQNNVLNNNLAFSAEIGIDIPDRIALLTSIPMFESDSNTYHIGLRKLAISGGIRPKSYQSYGGTVGLHLGVNHAFSFIFIDVTGYQSRLLQSENETPMTLKGVSVNVGLTFIL